MKSVIAQKTAYVVCSLLGLSAMLFVVAFKGMMGAAEAPKDLVK